MEPTVSPSTAWARKNPEKHREYARKAQAKRVALIRAAKEAPCVDCGIRLPAEVMELDHVRGQKAFGFGSITRSKLPAGFTSWADAIAAEILKCEVRCPNCHRMRHYLENGKVALHAGS